MRLEYRFSRLVLFALLLSSVTATRELAADDLDNIVFEGTVRDGTGALIEGADVRIVSYATGAERAGVTNSTGRYRLTVFEPGRYTLTVAASGFKEEQLTHLEVTAGRKVSNDFTLQPGGASEEVVVTASISPPLDITRTVAGDTIEGREFDQLPVLNRDPLQLVFLLGGVSEAPLSTAFLADEGAGVFLRGTPEEAGSFSLTGAPATSNNITIDGLDNNDDRTARERITLNPEAVAELQVITNQYAAEYGRASGGRINIRTRSGGNTFHGDVYAYFADESLNANTFFRNARGFGRLPLQQRREGGAVSGPLQGQKHFFFGGYERLDVPDSVEIEASVPVGRNPLFPLPAPNLPVTAGSQTGTFFESVSTPETRNLLNVRADLGWSSSHNTAVRVDLARGANRRGFPGGSRLLGSLLVQGRDSDSVSATENLILSSKLIAQTRVQFSRLVPRNSGRDGQVGIVIRDPPLTAGGFSGSDSSPAFAREEKRLQIQNNLTAVLGTHVLKAGGDLQLVRSSFADLFAVGGLFTFDSAAEFLANIPSRFQQRFDTVSRTSNNVTGLFVQDEWKVRSNFTLSYGIRWDDESILVEGDNVSPRVAIAWDPFGGKFLRGLTRLSEPGKTVIRAGFGLFANRALLRTIDDFSLGRTSTIIDSDLNREMLSAVRFPRPVTDQRLIQRFGVKETGFLRRISHGLQIPYTVQTGLGIERQLTKNLIATADFIFTRGVHLWRETNINAPLVPAGMRNLTEFLLSRDFDNRAGLVGGRPITGTNADIVRFDLSRNTSTTPGAIVTRNGVRIVTLGLKAPRSSNIGAALNAVRHLRPEPSLTQVELLESTGNSFYHGGLFSARYSGRSVRFRVVYTISKLIDEGTTNTASPQDLFDRRAERALSLQDQRHRLVAAGTVQVPLFKVDVASVVAFGSSRPFNIGSGFDRNLNDISNDRPNFVLPLGRPRWRHPDSAAGTVRGLLELAPIGSIGNLPRNYGRGPGTRTINLRVARQFTMRERLKIRPAVDVFNVFNNTVFSFGSEFIDRDDEDFLVPRRTQSPRSLLVSIKVSF